MQKNKTSTMFRKRMIPEECVELKDDMIIYQDEERLVTKWKTLKPRKDFSCGYSCYYLKDGYKVSKFLKQNGELKCWYCDIIKTEWKPEENVWIFTDLLADVILTEDKKLRVVDLDELAEAFERGLLTSKELAYALRCLDNLLKKIETGEFEEMKKWLEQRV